MLKALIWGSDAAAEEEEEGLSDAVLVKQEPRSKMAASREDPATNHPEARLRSLYKPRRGGALRGPLSVNDPQLATPPLKVFNPILSESYFALCSPFGPFGTKKRWRLMQRDHPEHVHRLVRTLMAAQDYAGAARALATLHRLQYFFDPDVYRYTVALLHLSGNHREIVMYYRKVVGIKARSVGNISSLQGVVIAHDLLAYLADCHEYDEALRVSQDLLQHGNIKRSPSIKAHGAILLIFAALLEHQNARSLEGGDGARHPPPRIPDLQDPISLMVPLRLCWEECSRYGDGGGGGRASGEARMRAFHHLEHAKRLLKQAAGTERGSASIAGYRATITAAEAGTVAALQQLARFVKRHPESVRGRALHARLLDKAIRDARARFRVKKNQDAEEEGRGKGEKKKKKKQQQQEEQEHKQERGAEAGHELLVTEVARACALRDWLEIDPLEPRAALGLAALHAERSGAAVGVADAPFVAKRLVDQLETHGFPRTCPSATEGSAGSRGSLPTTRAAIALWGALADILGPLRVRDEPVPLPLATRGGDMFVLPRPGTMWDHLYGADPPWAPTDFQQRDDPGARSVGGGGSLESGDYGLPVPPTLHPHLTGVDKELWEDTLLDPRAEPLLETSQTAAWAGAGGEVYFSDDEDCVLYEESEVLEENARIASRRTGGCVYYTPPGGENGPVQRPSMLGVIREALSEPGSSDRGGRARAGFPEKGAAGLRGEAAAAPENYAPGSTREEKQEILLEIETRDSGKDAQRPRKRARGPGAVRGRDDEDEDLGEGDSSGNDYRRDEALVEGSEPASPEDRRRQRDGKARASEQEGATGGKRRRGDVGESDARAASAVKKPRSSVSGFVDDDEDEEVMGAVGVEQDIEIDGNDEAEGGGGLPPGLWEEDAPLGPPRGIDPVATRLSETVSVRLPEEAAVWLLANKCCVAAHIFGPQHRYCLKAIDRLCRKDVWEIGRSARETLRSRGFRLALSSARLANDERRAEAAATEGNVGVAWGLPERPFGNALPLDSYVPEPLHRAFGASARADDGNGRLKRRTGPGGPDKSEDGPLLYAKEDPPRKTSTDRMRALKLSRIVDHMMVNGATTKQAQRASTTALNKMLRKAKEREENKKAREREKEEVKERKKAREDRGKTKLEVWRASGGGTWYDPEADREGRGKGRGEGTSSAASPPPEEENYTSSSSSSSSSNQVLHLVQ